MMSSPVRCSSSSRSNLSFIAHIISSRGIKTKHDNSQDEAGLRAFPVVHGCFTEAPQSATNVFLPHSSEFFLAPFSGGRRKFLPIGRFLMHPFSSSPFQIVHSRTLSAPGGTTTVWRGRKPSIPSLLIG